MDLKKIIFALIVTSLLIGGACAASVNDFNFIVQEFSGFFKPGMNCTIKLKETVEI